ncbi:MAG: YkgJ family cysteine cluster protein, partial [Haloarculaceae archaeon]
MAALEADLDRARDLEVAALADAIEAIGFECTRCGACCKAHEDEGGDTEEHTATVFPDEVRRLQQVADGDDP